MATSDFTGILAGVDTTRTWMLNTVQWSSMLWTSEHVNPDMVYFMGADGLKWVQVSPPVDPALILPEGL